MNQFPTFTKILKHVIRNKLRITMSLWRYTVRPVAVLITFLVVIILIPPTLSLFYSSNPELTIPKHLELESLSVEYGNPHNALTVLYPNFPNHEPSIYESDSQTTKFEARTQDMEKILKGEPFDPNYLDRISSEFASSISKIISASSADYYHLPEIASLKTSPEIRIPPINSLRIESYYVAMAAISDAHRGYYQSAFKKADSLVRLGQLILDGRTSLIEKLIAIRIKSTGLATYRILALQNRDTNPSQSTQLFLNTLKYLDRIGTNDLAFQQMVMTNMIEVRNSISQKSFLYSAVDTNIPKLSPNLETSERISKYTHNRYNFRVPSVFNDLLTVSNNIYTQQGLLCAEYTEMKVEEGVADDTQLYIDNTEQPLIQRITKYFLLYMTPNGFGRNIGSLAEQSLRGLKTRTCTLDTEISATQSLIALKMYELEHGTYPNSLNELVLNLEKNPAIANIVEKSIIDPFSGTNFVYSKEHNLLYSVGADKVDNGGDLVSDIVFQMK